MQIRVIFMWFLGGAAAVVGMVGMSLKRIIIQSEQEIYLCI